MDVSDRIAGLESTTFAGRRFSRKQLEQIASTVSEFPNLSRNELALTICEHFNWSTEGKKLKTHSALSVLEKLEQLGICSLPGLQTKFRRGAEKRVSLVLRDQPAAITCDLADLSPLSLQIVESKEDRNTFKALMDEYHYLGYRHPCGAQLRYFIHDKNGNRLGLLLFAASAWSLKERDDWIGWQRRHRLKRLHFVVSNSRFLIFPQVKVKNLASKVLSLIIGQLADDWQTRYGYKPVLIETFVDTQKYVGTCYQAANWTKLGTTTGRGRSDEHTSKGEPARKDIYVQPLVANFRDVLLRGEAARATEKDTPNIQERLCQVHDNVLQFWKTVAPLIQKICSEFDEKWRIRRRVINTMLLVMLIFRLVATRSKHGYGTVIDELWENCRKQGLPLPQKKPITPSAFTEARKKLDEQIFKTINSQALNHFENLADSDDKRFFGHRLYAVDGTKINLPRALVSDGFKLPDKAAHYPVGLFSTLYRLRDQVPVDFELLHRQDERAAALKHFSHLSEGDVVVYDRGYYGYAMLYWHVRAGIHPVFRLQTKNITPIIEDFATSDQVDEVVTIEPPNRQQKTKIRQAHTDIIFKPLTLRLVKYECNGTTFCLGTTLLDARYTRESFMNLYHERWSVEELYKISKQFIGIEEFHAKSLRGVRQELYAHMTMITLTRVFTNHTDDLYRRSTQKGTISKSEGRRSSNFKNSMAAMARNLESLIFATVELSLNAAHSILGATIRRHQPKRPNRSYVRRSRRPMHKWSKLRSKRQEEMVA